MRLISQLRLCKRRRNSGGGGAFDPSQNENTIGWFDLYGDSLTLSGSDITAVSNQISGSSVTMAQDGANAVPTNAGLINGRSVAKFDSPTTPSRLLIDGLPTTGTLNFFVGLSDDGVTSQNSVLRNSTNTYLAIGEANNNANSNLTRVDGTNDPAGLESLFDNEASQSVSTRGAWVTAFRAANLVAFVGVPALTGGEIRLGDAGDTYNLDADVSRVVIVTGTMTAQEISDMQNYFAAQDGWA